ncbi:hypothetical protein RSA42_00060 [Exiguobacterium indicum]|uniref:hypothetical protein n=1 Tax=Exiguobacterium TaxID=33986 RepID=UPI0007371D3B|nr:MULTISPECIES: hypothetical protein [Exiguobacterium]KTR62555.1 hypothetical protein RSA42_00060 [Exiguobacterium indicum]
MKYTCPVCGYDRMDDVAYYENGDASFELCSCCGFQFVVDDDVEIEDGIFLSRSEAHDLYRSNWLKDGAKIFSPHAFKTMQDAGDYLERTILQKQLQRIHITLDN